MIDLSDKNLYTEISTSDKIKEVKTEPVKNVKNVEKDKKCTFHDIDPFIYIIIILALIIGFYFISKK
jgi:hypothetical protein